ECTTKVSATVVTCLVSKPFELGSAPACCNFENMVRIPQRFDEHCWCLAGCEVRHNAAQLAADVVAEKSGAGFGRGHVDPIPPPGLSISRSNVRRRRNPYLPHLYWAGMLFVECAHAQQENT